MQYGTILIPPWYRGGAKRNAYASTIQFQELQVFS